MTPILETKGLSKQYESRLVLNNVDLKIEPGEKLAIIGPSGSGKSTLLNCLGGEEVPDSGEIFFEGKRVDRYDEDFMDDLQRHSLGKIYQFFFLLPQLTAYENIELPLMLLQIDTAERKERINKYLDRLGIEHRKDAYPNEMSGGEMQRVAIARALVKRPALILADEPTGSLDSKSSDKLLLLLNEVTEEDQISLIIVTHDLDATKICDRTLEMNDGQFV